ncbi:MAG: hypothetical protein EOP09_12315, partial [Proteobacteria bacterium]
MNRAWLTFIIMLNANFAQAASFAVPSGPTALAHSHNDYQQRHPLDEALKYQFRSIEVDIIDRGGQARVTHLGLWTDGTLQEMYLDKLQKRVNEKGS